MQRHLQLKYIQNNAVSHILDNADVIVNNTEALIDFASWVYKCMEAIESVESDRYKDIYDLEKAKETLTTLANNQNSTALTTSQLQNIVNKKGFSIQLSKCIDVNQDNVKDYIVLAYKSGKTPTWGEKEYLLIVDGKQSKITQCHPIDYMEYSDIIAKECKGIVHFLIKIEGELMNPYAMYSVLNSNKLVEHNQFIRRADPTLWLTNDGIKFVYSGSNIKPIFKLSHSEYQTIKKEWAYKDGSGFIECFGGVAEAYFDGDTLVVKSDKFGFFIHSYFEWNGSLFS